MIRNISFDRLTLTLEFKEKTYTLRATGKKDCVVLELEEFPPLEIPCPPQDARRYRDEHCEGQGL